MKIEVNKIPAEGLVLSEELSAREMDLGIGVFTSEEPVSVTASVSRITNAVNVRVAVSTVMRGVCSRCLADVPLTIEKKFELNYPVDKAQSVIQLDPEIREELILDIPVKPLCTAQCKGLCPRCGKNLNEGGCSCGTT